MKHLFFLTLTATLLSACGGGGGSDTSPSPTPDNVSVKNHYHIDMEGKKSTNINSKTTEKPLVNILINGKTYSLPQQNDFLLALDNGWALQGSRMKHVVRGEYGKDEHIHLFIQGDATPIASMPSTGKAVYTGDGRWITHVNESQTIYTEQGSSTFDVDFANKTIEGTISAQIKNTQQKQNIDLEATISGSHFSGTKNNITMQGSFFGSQAEEMAGFLQSTDLKTTGIFGASKQ